MSPLCWSSCPLSPRRRSKWEAAIRKAISAVLAVALSTMSVLACGSETPTENGPPAVASVEVTFTAQPTKTQRGTSITPAVEVEIRDALGNTVTDATDAVTLVVGNNPSGGSLSGTLTRSAVNGVATFDDLSIDKAGAGYTLSATSGNLAAAMSEAFDIEPAPCTDDTATVVTLTFSGDAQPPKRGRLVRSNSGAVVQGPIIRPTLRRTAFLQKGTQYVKSPLELNILFRLPLSEQAR